MPVAVSWLARVDQLSKLPFAVSQIVSIHLETGKRDEYTTGPASSLRHTFCPTATSGTPLRRRRSPAWLIPRLPGEVPDHSALALLVARRQAGGLREDRQPAAAPASAALQLGPKYDYFYGDVFPSFSKDGLLVITSKDTDSSIVVQKADGTDRHVVFKAETNCKSNESGPCGDMTGVGFAPSWSPDGQWIVFGFGGYLRMRNTSVAKIMMVKRDGTGLTELTSGTPNTGFPALARRQGSCVPLLGAERGRVAHHEY